MINKSKNKMVKKKKTNAAALLRCQRCNYYWETTKMPINAICPACDTKYGEE